MLAIQIDEEMQKKKKCGEGPTAPAMTPPLPRATRYGKGSTKKKTTQVDDGLADLIFRWQNGVLIATVPPPSSQVARSTPLGIPCYGLPVHGAPRPGLRMSLRLRFCAQSGYVPVPPRGSQLGGLRVPPPVYPSGRGFY
jgi:hypothetical protein